MSGEHSDVILERMMSLHPKIIDLTLDRVWRLLGAVGNPHEALAPVIHIAGTNGKGSTQAMIRAGLEAVGQRVQAYTSPHLARFNERISLAGGNISEAALSDVLAECELANGGAAITYFEITTVAALLAFSREVADHCLLEVGLGGRLDATNVIDRPALTVITPVSVDHQQFLGDTIEQIAGEKAGILKPGVPCIVGRQVDAARDVIEDKARKVGASLLIAGQDWDVWEEHGRLAFQDQSGLLDLPLPNLLGAHQADNAGMAIAALRGLEFPEQAALGAVTKAVWPARMQKLRDGPLLGLAPGSEIWLDGGHNPAAGEALAETLGRLPQRPTFMVAGMLNTKDVAGYFKPLAGRVSEVLAVGIPGEAATLKPEETASAALKAGLNAEVATSVEAAVTAIADQHPGARILIGGSLYLAGHILRTHS